jgi:proteasome lid subunit RPN8/RPN11
VLEISTETISRLTEHAESAYPQECCGALVGERAGDGAVVAESVPATNVARAATSRFEIDPGELLALHRHCRERGLEVVGYYHSHPDGSPRPSELDRRNAWPELSYLIVAVDRGGAGPVCGWRLHDDRFVSQRLLSGAGVR